MFFVFFVKLFEGIDLELFYGKIVFLVVKGIILEYNVIFVCFIYKIFWVFYDFIGIICGFCYVEEVVFEWFFYLIIVCLNDLYVKEMVDMLVCCYIKMIILDDLFGIEFSVVFKNVYVLVCGICVGLGYGDNF